MVEKDLDEQYNTILDLCLKDAISVIGFEGNKLVTVMFKYMIKVPDGDFDQITDFTSEA